jgi:pimeloyl-ACP methyl ester carboxylesterase
MHALLAAVVGIVLVGGYLAAQVSPQQTTVASPQDRFFDSNGVRIRYVEQGTGQPVILVHGNGASLETWTNTGVFHNLSGDHRVIAFDARGHGKSDKPRDRAMYGREMALDIVRLLDHLKTARAHIVGYSFGGSTTAQLLTMHPERFLTAALIAGDPRLEWTTEQARLAEQEASEIERECVSRTQMLRLAATPLTEAAIKAASAACFADSNRDRFVTAAIRRSYADQVITPAQAAGISVPVIAVVGNQDPTQAGLEAFKKVKPNLTLVIVDGATHVGERGILRRTEMIAAVRQFFAVHRPTNPLN